MTTKATSRKVLASIQDFDSYDCTDSGFIWTLYADGRVTAEYHTRWSGSTTGDRYTTDSDYLQIEIGEDPKTELKKLRSRLDYRYCEDFDQDRAFRMTKKGIKIR